MPSSLCFFVNYTFLCLISTAFAKHISPGPWALTFAPSFIITSRWTPSGHIKSIKYIPGDDYIEHLSNAVSHHGRRSQNSESLSALLDTHKHDQVSATSIFRSAVNTVSQNMSTTLKSEQPPIFNALFVPTSLNYSSSCAASDAVFPNGRFEDDGPKEFGYAAHAPIFAYGMDRCEGIGRTPAECEDEDSLANFALVVEYERQYVHANLVEVDTKWQVFPIVGGRLSKNLGEESGRQVEENISAETYEQKILAFLQTLLQDVLITPYGISSRENIRAIVVSGEASTGAVLKMQDLAREAVGNGVVKIFDTIEPSLVTAYGAAKKARDTVLKPEVWGYPPVKQHDHDEL